MIAHKKPEREQTRKGLSLNRRGPGDTLLVAVGETRKKDARSANYQEKKRVKNESKKETKKGVF